MCWEVLHIPKYNSLNEKLAEIRIDLRNTLIIESIGIWNCLCLKIDFLTNNQFIDFNLEKKEKKWLKSKFFLSFS